MSINNITIFYILQFYKQICIIEDCYRGFGQKLPEIFYFHYFTVVKIVKYEKSKKKSNFQRGNFNFQRGTDLPLYIFNRKGKEKNLSWSQHYVGRIDFLYFSGSTYMTCFIYCWFLSKESKLGFH